MNIINKRMLNVFFREMSTDMKLSGELEDILNEGFIFKNDCCFLKRLYNSQTNITSSDFSDKVGYECFVNSIHIDDYVEQDFFYQTILFAKKTLQKWNELHNKNALVIIIGESDYGFNVKIHINRKNEIWIDNNDLDSFEEGILYIVN